MTKLSDAFKASAPLPADWTLVAQPTKLRMQAEAKRAALELVWALHRQRTAWSKLARIKDAFTERNIEWVENERPYKLAVGDVQWWRGEVSSRANALSALLAAIQYFDD